MAKEVAFKALEYTITELSKGDVKLKAPEPAGFRALELPAGMRSWLGKSVKKDKKVIFSYRSWWGAVWTYESVDQDGVGSAKRRSDESPSAFGYEIDPEVVETVNIKLECKLQYDGPEIVANFDTTVDGSRSRLGAETAIEIKPQLDLETREAPEAWKKVGLEVFPVLTLPVRIFVDQPWPTENFNASFDLVLSGMYGFGTSSGGPFQENYTEHNS